MSTGYALAYRIGITPWERAGEGGAEQLSALFAREEAGRTPPYGKALDLGCGTGAHAIELATRGWEATGVDLVPRALETARARAGEAAATVRFVPADVTRLSTSDVGDGFRFFLDVGCFHGLRDDQREAMGREVTAVAAPDATLLLLAFRPGRRRLLPRGAGADDVRAAFEGWDLVDDILADTSGMPAPLRRTGPHWFRLVRRPA